MKWMMDGLSGVSARSFLLHHWHPPSQTIASFAPGWRSPKGSLKSSSGSSEIVGFAVGLTFGSGFCVSSFSSGDIEEQDTKFAEDGEKVSPNLGNVGAVRHAFAGRKLRDMVCHDRQTKITANPSTQHTAFCVFSNKPPNRCAQPAPLAFRE